MNLFVNIYRMRRVTYFHVRVLTEEVLFHTFGQVHRT